MNLTGTFRMEYLIGGLVFEFVWGRSSGEGTLENHTVQNHTESNKSATALRVSKNLSWDA